MTTRYVSPAAPVPSTDTKFPLLPSEIQFGHWWVITTVWLFPTQLDDALLQQSLSLLLSECPWLCSRICEKESAAILNTNNAFVPFHITTNDDDGNNNSLHTIDARAKKPIATAFGQTPNHDPYTALVDTMDCEEVMAGHTAPMSAKLCRFVDGCSLGVAISHALMDGASLYATVSRWAEICRSLSASPPAQAPPPTLAFTRCNVPAIKNTEPAETERKFQAQGWNIVEKPDMNDVNKVMRAVAGLQRHMETFTNTELEEIKRTMLTQSATTNNTTMDTTSPTATTAATTANLSANTGTVVPMWLSTFECLCAHVVSVMSEHGLFDSQPKQLQQQTPPHQRDNRQNNNTDKDQSCPDLLRNDNTNTNANANTNTSEIDSVQLVVVVTARNRISNLPAHWIGNASFPVLISVPLKQKREDCAPASQLAVQMHNTLRDVQLPSHLEERLCLHEEAYSNHVLFAAPPPSLFTNSQTKFPSLSGSDFGNGKAFRIIPQNIGDSLLFVPNSGNGIDVYLTRLGLPEHISEDSFFKTVSSDAWKKSMHPHFE
eukprot:c7986_g1_i1.p1 GENE.c7986_g1_i1~~c7986_g1_i1.p1  ORF type:complete len:546 (+),score=156.64 c7986_g1_i1:141-1778(+)